MTNKNPYANIGNAVQKHRKRKQCVLGRMYVRPFRLPIHRQVIELLVVVMCSPGKAGGYHHTSERKKNGNSKI